MEGVSEASVSSETVASMPDVAEAETVESMKDVTEEEDSVPDLEEGLDAGAAGNGADAASDDADLEDDPAATTTEQIEAKLIKALSFKDRGNADVGKQDFSSAQRHYQRGLKLCNSLPGNDQAAGLAVSLNLNLSLASYKLGQHADAARAAAAVLAAEPANVKALYRRGVARAALGDLADARADLTAVVRADPKNGTARKELTAIKARVEAAKHAEKAAYGGVFARSGSLYDDRQAEQAVRRQVQEAKWRRDNDDRLSLGLGHRSFDEWSTAEAAVAAKAAADADAADLADVPPLIPMPGTAAPPAVPAVAAATAGAAAATTAEGATAAGAGDAAGSAWAAGGSSSLGLAAAAEGRHGATTAAPTGRLAVPPCKATKVEDDDDAFDEEDLKIINETKKQGYCYFRREVAETDAKLLAEEQARLRAAAIGTATAPANGVALSSDGSPSNGNAAALAPVKSQLGAADWNAGGTWEEIDKTSWAKQRLAAVLETLTVVDGGVDLASDPAAVVQAVGGFDFDARPAAEPGAAGAEALAALGARLARLTARVTGVRDLEGNAHVVLARNRKKCLFDFAAALDVKILADESMGLSGGGSGGEDDVGSGPPRE
ncbi:unnamed protein product, partial [Phaeothamnion confervicola]